MEEKFDIVDNQGRPLGYTKSKSIVHKEGLWHRSVHIWIINSKNEILLQKRSANKKIGPNLWDISVAGHMSAGDTSKKCAVREIKEELGIDINPQKLEFLETVRKDKEYPPYIEREFNDIYLLCWDLDINSLTFCKEEVAEVKYVPIEEFLNMIKIKDKTLIEHEEDFRVLLQKFNYLWKVLYMSKVDIAKSILKKDLSKIKYSYKMLQTPQETIDNKKGECLEQAELTRYLLAQNNITSTSYFLEMNRGGTTSESWKNFIGHAFVVFEDNQKHYWFERPYCSGKYIGVHEYDNLNELLVDVVSKTKDSFENDYKMPTNNIVIHKYDAPEFPIAYTDHLFNCLAAKVVYPIEKK